MEDFLYATIKDPSLKKLRTQVRERYIKLYELTEEGTVPLRFKIKDNGKIRYDDPLAEKCGMEEVITRKNKVNIIPHKIRKQYLLPI